MNINEYKFKNSKKDLIVQANNAELLYDIIIFLREHMATKTGISLLIGLSDRQVDYYCEALGAMEVTDYFQVGSRKFIGLKENINFNSKKEFATYLKTINFIKKQLSFIASSTLATATKTRRESGIKSLNKWIGEQ